MPPGAILCFQWVVVIIPPSKRIDRDEYVVKSLTGRRDQRLKVSSREHHGKPLASVELKSDRCSVISEYVKRMAPLEAEEM